MNVGMMSACPMTISEFQKKNSRRFVVGCSNDRKSKKKKMLAYFSRVRIDFGY